MNQKVFKHFLSLFPINFQRPQSRFFFLHFYKTHSDGGKAPHFFDTQSKKRGPSFFLLIFNGRKAVFLPRAEAEKCEAFCQSNNYKRKLFVFVLIVSGAVFGEGQPLSEATSV